MLKLVKFMVLGGLAFWLTTPSLDGGGWDSFLIVFGVLSLMLNRPPSERDPMDRVKPTSVGLEDEEEDNRLKDNLLTDHLRGELGLDVTETIKGTPRNPFGDPFSPHRSER